MSIPIPAPSSEADARWHQLQLVVRATLISLSLLLPLYLAFAVPSRQDATVGWSGTPLHPGSSGGLDGLLVTRTTWPVNAAGLLPGDVVLSVNGQPASHQVIELHDRTTPPGDSIQLEIVRDGERLTRSVPVVVSPPSYFGYLWYRFLLALAAWIVGTALVAWRGDNPAALSLGAAMLLVAPVTLAVTLSINMPGSGPLVRVANGLWQLQAGAYRFFFPALLLHFLMLHSARSALLRSRTLWTGVYVTLAVILLLITDSFRETQAWRGPGLQQDIRTGAGLIFELIAVGCSLLVVRRIPSRRNSLRWLMLTALLFLLAGIPVSAAVLAPGAPSDVVAFLRQVKSLMLLLLVVLSGLYIFTRGDEVPGQWDFRSRLASSASFILTGLFGFAVAGAAAIVHSLEQRLGAVEGLLFITIFLAAILFSPVLRWAREMVDRQMFARWTEIEARAHAFVDRIGSELEPDRIAERFAREAPAVLDISHARLVLARELIGTWSVSDELKLSSQPLAVLVEKASRGRDGDDVLAPVYHQNGEILGVLRFGRRLDGQEFEPPEYATLRTLSQGVAAALRNAEAYVTLRRAEQELAEAERIASLGALASGLAHEIKNPLASLQMGLYLLKRERADPARVQRISRDAQRIDDLVSGLLHYTDRGHVEPPEPVDLRSVVSLCVADVRDLVQDMGASIVEHYPTEAAVLVGRPSQLRVVVSNLIVNAIESIHEGGLITVGLERSASSVEFTVLDDGPGIPAELRERIFELNFSTKPGGTGLGLTLARREIERLGGWIEITSGETMGTLLRVTLPMAM